ncbi:unnamed protein product [Chrysoparadoxa australica]
MTTGTGHKAPGVMGKSKSGKKRSREAKLKQKRRKENPEVVTHEAVKRVIQDLSPGGKLKRRFLERNRDTMALVKKVLQMGSSIPFSMPRNRTRNAKVRSADISNSKGDLHVAKGKLIKALRKQMNDYGLIIVKATYLGLVDGDDKASLRHMTELFRHKTGINLEEKEGPLFLASTMALRGVLASTQRTVINPATQADRKRHQVKLSSCSRLDMEAWGDNVKNWCSAHINRVMPYLQDAFQMEVSDTGHAVLLSEPGCKQQAPHRDFFYSATSALNKGRQGPMVAGAYLVALQDKTGFMAAPGSHDDVQRRKLMAARNTQLEPVTYPPMIRFQLDAGDILVFHGRLLHAGAAFECVNVRMHGYLNASSVLAPESEFEVASEVESDAMAKDAANVAAALKAATTAAAAASDAGGTLQRVKAAARAAYDMAILARRDPSVSEASSAAAAAEAAQAIADAAKAKADSAAAAAEAAQAIADAAKTKADIATAAAEAAQTAADATKAKADTAAAEAAQAAADAAKARTAAGNEDSDSD